jgi:hypothetical protein
MGVVAGWVATDSASLSVGFLGVHAREPCAQGAGEGAGGSPPSPLRRGKLFFGRVTAPKRACGGRRKKEFLPSPKGSPIGGPRWVDRTPEIGEGVRQPTDG